MTRTEGKRLTKSSLPEYRIWSHIKQRCHNERSTAYKKYGAKGIAVCPAWRESFEAFYEYMGQRPSPKHTIDRIDPSGNYEPGNVRWADYVVQANNRTNNVLVSYRGRQMTFHEAWRLGGRIVSRQSAWNRVHKFGWSVERAVEESPTPSAVNGGKKWASMQAALKTGASE